MSDIAKLRKHLFETLEGLKNKSIDIDQAKAISETAQVIINTAKAEVDFMKVTGQTVNSEFIPVLAAPANPRLPTLISTGFKQTEPVPGGTVTTHRLR